ncbi:MarR family winged helix-turn-helix transcriptional regulator [Kutzneria sp. NPDC052558]|uniref:MarR family winged helix-turn-helix transcriptional regulator n=1 Tax=Kutzneria sp. NPDC052558 TaxID=3364121 RepID=UPI0037C6CE26
MSTVDDSVRELLLLMPRLVGRAKKLPVPAELRSFALAPRHITLLAYLLFDGPLTVNELAARLEIAPTTASLMVGELSRQGVLQRTECPVDRRRTIVTITDDHRPAVERWLSAGANAWRKALAPLTREQRELFVGTLRAYQEAVCEG